MSDQFSGIESLLGLEQGSTAKIDPKDAPKVLTKAVKEKTNNLSKELDKVDSLQETMSEADLVKSGLSMEMLEDDKVTIRQEAFEVYRIAKQLLNKYKDDVMDQIDVNDRMYLAGGKLIDSVVGSIDKLQMMISRFRQEEELKGLQMGEQENNQKEMSTDQFTVLIEQVNNGMLDEDNNVIEAELVDEESPEEHEPESGEDDHK